MSIGQELSSIDFQSMIGGPLNAVIKAQAQSAQTSVDFIKSVGFNGPDGPDPGKPTMVSFTYDKIFEEPDENGKIVPVIKPMSLTVPILTMLPIPFIRVEEVTIDFNAKIQSVEESTTASSSELAATLGVKAGWGPVSAELKCSYSNKKSTSATAKTERTYSLIIHVRAVQDELPAGMEKLLGILENNIKDVEVTTTPPSVIAPSSASPSLTVLSSTPDTLTTPTGTAGAQGATMEARLVLEAGSGEGIPVLGIQVEHGQDASLEARITALEQAQLKSGR